MKSHSRALVLFACMVPLLVSCEKVFMDDDPGNDPVTVFEEIWTFTDRHYSFFEEKGIDWDAAYDEFRPRVDADMSPVELFDLCAEMLYELRDGHVNLLSPFDRSRYWEWYLNSPENFYFSIIEREYLRDRQRYIGPLIVAPVGEDDNILYVYYSSFGNFISDGNLDNLLQILNSIDNLKGLIIDVRNNGGGSTGNGQRIAARFTDERVFVGTNYIKNGPGHEDFRQEEVFIDPHDGLRYSGSVAVLTNRKSYSATTYFAQYMKAVDSAILIGDTTGGGGGIPAFHDLPNGWLLRVSSSRFYSSEDESIEPGVPPDIYAEIPVTDNQISLNKDDIIETAIEFLLNPQL